MTVVDRPTISEQFLGRFRAYSLPNKRRNASIYIRFARWWQQLQVFLTCQETAHEAGAWPDYAEVSHGRAGEIESEAEDVAKELGLLEEYRETVRNNSGRILYFAGRVNRSNMRLRNGRAECPCGRVDRQGRRLLRRQC
jgi:hypothetical protein